MAGLRAAAPAGRPPRPGIRLTSLARVPAALVAR